MRIGIVLVLATAATAASAQWMRDGAEAKETGWRRADGSFGAMLVLTKDVDAFYEEWSKPTTLEHQPRIENASTASRGEVVRAVLFFAGCEADATGKCRVDADFSVLAPDGSDYASHPGAEAWRGPPQPEAQLQLSIARLGISLEAADPVGSYRIRARVKDMVAGREVALERALSVD